MRRYIPAALSLLLGLLPVLNLFAQEEMYDAVYLSLTKEYTLNPDGSTDYRYIKEMKLQSYRAFNSLYGETFVTYDPVCQKLKINEAYTIMADGKKVPVPENAFNEVLPSAAANAPSYNNLREMVITHTGLERNAVIHLDYQIHTEKGLVPLLMGSELLAENEPVRKLTIQVRIPADKEIYHQVINSDCQLVRSFEGQYKVSTWNVTNIPAISSEENQQGGNELCPRLVFSTAETRDEAYGYLTAQTAFSAALPDEIKKAVNDWLEKKTDKFERALILQEQVVSNMRLYPVSLRNALYRCRIPEDMWNENGGTALEKAVLLAGMMRSGGIDAQPVAIVKTALSGNKPGVLTDIEDIAVKAEFKDKGSWIFSVKELNPVNLRLCLPGRTFIILKSAAKTQEIKADAPEQEAKVIGTFLISSDPKLTGEISIYLSGSAYPSAGMVRDRNKMKNSLSGRLIGSDTANLKVSTLNPENGYQTWIAKSEKPFKKDSNYYFFTLPGLTSGIDTWNIKTLSTKRSTPYEIPSKADESYSYTITLPAGMICFTPEKKINLSNKAGSFTWEVKSGDGKVSVRRQIKFNGYQFSTENYNDFKALMDCWNNPWYRQLVFKQ